jgi:hypothetical protein
MIRGKDCLSRLWIRDRDVIATLTSSMLPDSMATTTSACMNMYH